MSATAQERRPATEQASAWADELGNALAFSLFAAIYALLAGFILRRSSPGSLVPLLGAFGTGYAMAALLFVGVHAVAALTLGWAGEARRRALLPLAAPFACLIASVCLLPRLFSAADLESLVRLASFLGAGLALSTARGFYAGIQQRLVPAQRVRAWLIRHPVQASRLRSRVAHLLEYGGMLPWMLSALFFSLLPAPLKASLAASWILLTFVAHLLNRKLLEELAVWVFLHALQTGDYLTAARLPVRPARLAVEIEAAPPDLAAPFARFIAYGLAGPEQLALAPEALARLVRVYLDVYGVGAERLPGVEPEVGEAERESSIVRRLLDRGLRFRMEAEPSRALEPLPLPRWSALRRPDARARLAALYPGEPLWQVVARLYDVPIRGLLLPFSLLWLPLLLLALAWVGRGPWVIPLAGAALSFALLVWLTLLYSNWIFDQSLRRHDFAFLARQLGSGRMRGELEDALGYRDERVRNRAVELLLFDDEIARLGITVPPAGLRKFVRRSA